MKRKPFLSPCLYAASMLNQPKTSPYEFGPLAFRYGIAAEIMLGFAILLSVEFAMPGYWVATVTKSPPIGSVGDPLSIFFLIAPLLGVLALLSVTACLYFFIDWARYANVAMWILAVPLAAYIHYENHTNYPELSEVNWIIDIVSNLFWASALFVLALSFSGKTAAQFSAPAKDPYSIAPTPSVDASRS